MAREPGRSADKLDLANENKIDLPACQSITKKAPPSPRKRRYDKFLCGPVPLVWLTMAAKLSGKALHLGVALWYLAGLTKSFTIKVTRSTLDQFGISRWSVSRNLHLLELAGLVTVERRGGKAPLITIVEEPRTPYPEAPPKRL
ncbi:hypothetical protein [Methanoregula sp.]|jgi:hypothetical protein|uniref:hypothetical protein n=1 Tax=Methanoregula sp. TaxID=2052170 RepID=UPI003C1C03A8